MAEETTIEALARRLDLLEAERAIVETMYRYGHSIDYGLEEEWVDCFTEDGVFDVQGASKDAGRHEGREALARFISRHTRAPEAMHKHVVTQPRIVVDGDRATATSYLFRVDQYEQGPAIRSFGRYHDHLVRGADDVWRFRERRAEVEGRHPQAGHSLTRP